eukprot:6151831-Alexandrium_andersonii.AAC.2
MCPWAPADAFRPPAQRAGGEHWWAGRGREWADCRKPKSSSPVPKGALREEQFASENCRPANRKHPSPGARPTSSSPVPMGVLCRTGSP